MMKVAAVFPSWMQTTQTHVVVLGDSLQLLVNCVEVDKRLQVFVTLQMVPFRALCCAKCTLPVNGVTLVLHLL